MTDIRQHTVRLPRSLFEIIEMRSVHMGRSMNKEIEHLLKTAIKIQVEGDKALIEDLRRKVISEQELTVSPEQK